MANNSTSRVSLSSSPSLSPQLKTFYLSLGDDSRKVFIKVFRFLWRYMFDQRRYVDHGLLYYYWAVERSRLQYKLSVPDLSILSYLYQASKGGVIWLHSGNVYKSDALSMLDTRNAQNILSTFVNRGYLVRSFKDPDNPHYQSGFCSRPSFIRLTSSGVALIESIEKDLYNMIVNTSLEELTGKKKPG